MQILDKISYSTEVTVTGGREGQAISKDKSLEIKLNKPAELGGNGKAGTNPEQLFGAGYAACFLSALQYIAKGEKISFPTDVKIIALVNFGPVEKAFGLSIALQIHLPEMDTIIAHKLIEKADKVCPYSNAIRNNIEVQLNLI